MSMEDYDTAYGSYLGLEVSSRKLWGAKPGVLPERDHKHLVAHIIHMMRLN